MNALLRTCKYRKTIVISVSLCLLLFFASGCIDANKSMETTQEITDTATITETSKYSIETATSEITSVQETTTQKMSTETYDIDFDLSAFKILGECFIQYDFDVAINGTTEKPVSFLTQGEYDLNNDGIPDNIEILTRSYLGEEQNVQAYIKVNDMILEFYTSVTTDGEVRIIDLDKNDDFLEIAVFDEGPSGDPNYIFFRYNGKGLFKLGDIDDKALINGEGILLSRFNTSRFEPMFYSAWYEIENYKFIQKVNDIEKYLGNSYQFNGGEAYFMPVDGEEMPDDPDLIWDIPKQFEACEIKLLDIFFYPESRTLNFFFVELPDKTKGMMYFWIGD